MAKTPQATKAADKPTATAGAPTAAAATAAETTAQVAADAKEAEAKEAAAKAEEAKGVAEDQRQDIAAGGTGELDEAQAELAKGHSVSNPKDAPVDYAVQTARKPAQRLLNPDEVSADAMPRAPVATLPYGSEPRGFDPATGAPPVPEAAAEAVHGDDTDADTDRGSSAALREAAKA